MELEKITQLLIYIHVALGTIALISGTISLKNKDGLK